MSIRVALLMSMVAVAGCKLGSEVEPDSGASSADASSPDSGMTVDAGAHDAGSPAQPTCTGSQACVDGEICAWADVAHTHSVCKYHMPGSGMVGEPCNTSEDCPRDSHEYISCLEHPVYGGTCWFDDSFGSFCHECRDEALCYFEHTPALEIVCAARCTTTADCPAELECVGFYGNSPDPVRSLRFCQPQTCHCSTPDSFCFGNECYLSVPGCTLGERFDCPDPNAQACTNDNLCECLDGPCSQSCGTDADCAGESGLCVGGTCGHLDCSASSCHAGYACGVLRQTYEVRAAAQHCVPVGAGAIGDACSTPGDCAEGYCHLGQCVHRCATNADCGGDECGTSPAYPYDPPFCWSAPRCSNCSQPDQRCDEYRRCI